MTRTSDQRPRGALSRLVVPVVLLVLAAVLIAGVFQGSGQDAPVPVDNVVTVNVEVQVVAPLPALPDTIVLPAAVEPNRVVRVSAEVDGRIERIDCQEGTFCRAGDPLIIIDAELLRAEYDRAAAQAALDASRCDRIQNLFGQGAATDDERDAARASMIISQAAAEAAKVRLDRATIVAPIGGILNRVPVEKGEYLKVGDQVAEIVDVETVKVVVRVPELDIQFFSPGDTVEVLSTVTGREQTFAGTIAYISELADELTRTTRMEITVDNSRHLLRSGQIVRAKLTRRVLKDVIMVPLSAVIPLENGKAVYVVEAGKAQRRDVEIGLIRGRRVQILSGLQAGDRLILKGHRFVGPGQPVHVVAEES